MYWWCGTMLIQPLGMNGRLAHAAWIMCKELNIETWRSGLQLTLNLKGSISRIHADQLCRPIFMSTESYRWTHANMSTVESKLQSYWPTEDSDCTYYTPPVTVLASLSWWYNYHNYSRYLSIVTQHPELLVLVLEKSLALWSSTDLQSVPGTILIRALLRRRVDKLLAAGRNMKLTQTPTIVRSILMHASPWPKGNYVSRPKNPVLVHQGMKPWPSLWDRGWAHTPAVWGLIFGRHKAITCAQRITSHIAAGYSCCML